MKKRKIIWIPCLLSCALVILVFAYLWTADGKGSTRAISQTNERKNILIAGVDDAGFHTDMLMICSIAKDTGSMDLIQIPRDTYFSTKSSVGKINRIYCGYSSKYGKKDAAEMFSSTISKALGISIDAYVVFDEDVVKEFVDILGGVHMNVPSRITYFSKSQNRTLTLDAGERTLSGEEAVAVVRHRKGYVRGDLGRLDAQMCFLSSLYMDLYKLKHLNQYWTIYQKILPKLLTNLSKKDIINILTTFCKNRGRAEVSLMRLPGEALLANGTWYYVLRQAATEKMLTERVGMRQASFDKDAHFTDLRTEAFRNIYYDPDTAFRVYAPQEAANIKILQNG